MASVHVCRTTVTGKAANVYGGTPVGQTMSSGGSASTAALQTEAQVFRFIAVSGASYVKVDDPNASNPTAANGYYLSEGVMIDLGGNPGDKAFQADA